MESLLKQHRAWLMALGWWFLRRQLRRRAQTAVASLVSGETLGLRTPPKSRTAWWKWLLVLSVFGGVAWLAWRRLSGGGEDDWGAWDPGTPDPPVADAPVPSDDVVVSGDPAVPAGV